LLRVPQRPRKRGAQGWHKGHNEIFEMLVDHHYEMELLQMRESKAHNDPDEVGIKN
jgi:hypothetical protein